MGRIRLSIRHPGRALVLDWRNPGVVFYFALVLTIGFYLKQRANTSEDFFLAGREMTAWIAGLSFLSANLGSLELMGSLILAFAHTWNFMIGSAL